MAAKTTNAELVEMCANQQKTITRALSRISALSDEEYARSTRAKRRAIKKGKQFSRQPKSVADKTKSHRKFT